MQFGGHGDGDGEFNMPWGIDVDELGDVYVADWRNDRVQKFTADGEFIFGIGRSGDGEGEFNRPSGVTVDADGDIYVADWRQRPGPAVQAGRSVRRAVPRRRDAVEAGSPLHEVERESPQAAGDDFTRTPEARSVAGVGASGWMLHVHRRLRLGPSAGVPKGSLSARASRDLGGTAVTYTLHSVLIHEAHSNLAVQSGDQEREKGARWGNRALAVRLSDMQYPICRNVGKCLLSPAGPQHCYLIHY